MDKIGIFQERFGKVDELSSWDTEVIQTDTGTQFTSREFQAGLSVRKVPL